MASVTSPVAAPSGTHGVGEERKEGERKMAAQGRERERLGFGEPHLAGGFVEEKEQQRPSHHMIEDVALL